MKFGFTTTCAMSGYHHLSCGSEPRPFKGVLDTTLFDIVRQLLATGRRFSLVLLYPSPIKLTATI